MPYSFEPTSLAGKSIIISGGTTGIGRLTAYRLLSAGASVLIYGRHEKELEDALLDLRKVDSGKVYGTVADQSRHEDVLHVFEQADNLLGGLDMLINNAALGAEGVTDMEFEQWRYVIESNLIGYMDCCQQAIPRMKKHGQGHIVNIGSLSAQVREAGSDVYVATKSGIQGFSEALRKQVNKEGIKVTLIEPGLVGTDMTAPKHPVEKQPAEEEKGTMLKAEDIAECVYYTLTQPQRCDVVEVRIRPHGQEI